jgi:hypothetical protein
MAEDKLDFLDTQSAEVEAPEPEAVQVAEPVADKGEPPAPAPVSAPPAEVDTKQHVAPLTALLDEREKRQEAERKLRDYEARLAREAKAQPAPDFATDPAAALEYQRQVFQQQLYNSRLNTSRFMAEKDFGADTVKEAFEFFDKNPALSHQFVDHPSPFHAAVEFYKRQRVVEEVGADPQAYRAKLEAEIRAQVLAEMQTATPVQPKPRIPGSLAAAPAAGTQGELAKRGSSFDAAFG